MSKTLLSRVSLIFNTICSIFFHYYFKNTLKNTISPMLHTTLNDPHIINLLFKKARVYFIFVNIILPTTIVMDKGSSNEENRLFLLQNSFALMPIHFTKLFQTRCNKNKEFHLKLGIYRGYFDHFEKVSS